MEGTYLPAHRRSKIVKEVRSTHFHLGSDSKEYKTTNFSDYKTQKSTFAIVPPTAHISHIQLTNDQKSRFFSEFSSKYRSASEEPHTSPFKPVPALTLPTSQGTYTTTASKSYKQVEKLRQLPGLYKKTSENAAKKMNKHHFEVGSGQVTDYKSAMHRDFLYEPADTQAATAKEIMKKYVGSSKIGEKTGVYVSTTFQDYKERRADSPGKVIKTSEVTSIRYEEGSPRMQSTHMAQYSAKRVEDASLSVEKLNELKNSHVAFGNSPTNYTVASLQQSPVQSKLSIVKKQIPESSIRFGSESPEFQSDYASNFTHRPKSLRDSIILEKKSQNDSHITLGVVKNSYVTENRAVHKSLSESPGKLSPDAEKMLKTNHFTLGTEQNAYRSTSKDYGTAKEFAKVEKTFDQLSMNKSNWGFGNHPTQKKTDFQQEYQWRGPETKHKSEKTSPNKCHFQIGTGQSTWTSNYNSNFGWIKPVPDNDYKISLMK